jgi:O-antigen/teichoic acid export membrane protein
MLDSQAVGIYASAVKLSEAWYFVPIIISSSLFPAIIESKKISEELYYERLQKLYDFLVVIALAIVIPTTLLSDWVIDILYGQAYFGAGAVLSIHIWAGLFVFLGVARGKWILTENLQKYTFMYTSIGAVSNIILNLYLIPVLGINGAAFATLISQFIAVILGPFFIKQTRISVYMLLKSIFFVSIIRRIRYLLLKKY